MSGRRHFQSIALPACCLALALGLTGCGGSGGELNTEYGVRRAPRGSGSVGGVGVLADMFEERGHRVSTWKHLSPKIRENDVIIWAPDDLTPPTEEARKFLEDWLFAQNGRTLIYIGRDYFPEVEYWQTVREGAPAAQTETIQRRLARARVERDNRRAALPVEDPMYGRWFTLETAPPREVDELSGDWIHQLNRQGTPVDEEKLDIQLGARLRKPTNAEIAGENEKGELEFDELLTADGEVLVQRVTFAEGFIPPSPDPEANDKETDDSAAQDAAAEEDYFYDDEPLFVEEYAYDMGPRTSDSQILVVANGSFLLNLPLVNSQHRLLAGELIEECEYHEQLRVAVLETDWTGANVYLAEPDMPSYLELFTVWPLNVILLHLLGLGILACFFFAPIFGRPIDRRVLTVVEGRPIYVSIGSESTGPSDFGKHIEALGELMRRTGDVQYAQARLQHYQQNVRRDSGVSHKKPPPTKPPVPI
ncbi:MAG: hypothetical protein RIC55_15320 [Pirellulaceae bacterium]